MMPSHQEIKGVYSMGKVICTANQKGGVGKTATANNIASSLALEGKQVLVVDLDPLCTLTKANGYDPSKFDSSVVTLLENPLKVGQTIYESDIEGLSFIPSSPMLDVLELSLINKKDKYSRLKKALDKVKPIFDYIVLDCAPSLSTFTINALVAADYLIVPAETKYQSDFSLEVFLSTFETMKATMNSNLRLLGVIATMFNCQANEDKEVLNSIQSKYDLLGVIKRTTAVSSSVKKGKPCVVANRRTVVAQEYREITRKIMNMMEE